MKALVGGSLVALGMATFAEPAPRLDGVYATPNEIAGYFGEVLRLEAGGFEYWSYSDVVKDSEPKYPIRGTFQIHGDEILLITEETIPAHRYCLTFRDTQMLLRTDALQIWKRDRKLYPYGCLIRTHLSPEQIATTNRPSIAIFGAENIAEWH